MESFDFKNVSFSYPEESNEALHEVSFTIKQGEFIILCGPSGCGKSTLLHHMKSCLSPKGQLKGDITFDGKLLWETDDRTQAEKIGFVSQSTDNQIVTDKVWHELAFGLESLGYDTPTIRKRVAEIAAFFGIEKWFYKSITELSGGQKQILSLASVMAMNPEVLVLDEPTSQLDPIAAADFLALLGKINRELGITVVLTEHRLEEAFPLATRVLVMERGEIICDDTPHKVGIHLRNHGNAMFLAMPTAMRVWASLETTMDCPMTVRDGSQFLTERQKEQPIGPLIEKTRNSYHEEVKLQCNNVWFRYEKTSPDVLRGFSITLHKGEFYAILGSNGAGKTTSLKVIAELCNPYRGSVQVHGKIGMLPQNPQALFVKRTVREDLYEALNRHSLSKEEMDDRVASVVALCSLHDFLDRHPYDISGGEQQRCALAKVILTTPDILLLDEPTKGFDAEFKMIFSDILDNLLKQGISILMVSHDVPFCAEYAHRCGLFFDGNIVTEDFPRAFFSGNSFYTTPANRMARHIIPNAITVDEIISCCGGKVPLKRESHIQVNPLPEPMPRSINFKPKPLKLYRKIIAAISGLSAILVFFYATSITDLSAIVNASGVSEAGEKQLMLYGILFVSLLTFLLAIGRRSMPPLEVQTPKEKRKLSKRTLAATLSILVLIPLTIFIGIFYIDDKWHNVIALIILFLCMLPFMLIFEDRKPQPRELVTIAVLCAMGVAGRSLFFMLPQFKPVLALTIIAGIAFGGETGFLVGAVTMLTSNMLFSQGPWTPFQMFAMGIIGFLAGILFKKGWLRRTRGSLAIFGALSAIVIYGGIMNPASLLMFSPESINMKTLIAYYITGLPMDLIHAFATVVFIMLASEAMLEKMDRIKVKYGLVE